MEQTIQNPAILLQQALSMMMQPNNPVIIDYDKIVSTAVNSVRKEREKIFDKVLVTKNEAHVQYGKNVINALVKRGFLQEYKFDTRKALDREGNEITKAKGVIYFRVAEIEQAIEDGNVLKGTRRGTI